MPCFANMLLGYAVGGMCDIMIIVWVAHSCLHVTSISTVLSLSQRAET